jgi:hypothetical protein
VVPGQPGLRSVDREQVGRVIEPRNDYRCGSRRLGWTEGNTSAREGSGLGARGPEARGASRSHRGRRAGHACRGVSREPGRSSRLHPRTAAGTVGSRHIKSPDLRAVVVRAARGETLGDGVVPRPRRQRSGVGWTVGSRSVRVVPLNAGNRPMGPAGGKGAPESGAVGGERCQTYRSLSPSQRDNDG